MTLILLQIAIGSLLYLMVNAWLLRKNQQGVSLLDRVYAAVSANILPVNRYFFDWLTLVLTPTGIAVGAGVLVPLIGSNS